jgi:hypothetical protein
MSMVLLRGFGLIGREFGWVGFGFGGLWSRLVVLIVGWGFVGMLMVCRFSLGWCEIGMWLMGCDWLGRPLRLR